MSEPALNDGLQAEVFAFEFLNFIAEIVGFLEASVGNAAHTLDLVAALPAGKSKASKKQNHGSKKDHDGRAAGLTVMVSWPALHMRSKAPKAMRSAASRSGS